MELNEALDTLKKAGIIAEANAGTGNVQSYFEIAEDEDKVSDWFMDDVIYDTYGGQIDTKENSAGHTIVHLRGRELLPELAKRIFNRWADDMAGFSINVWRS